MKTRVRSGRRSIASLGLAAWLALCGAAAVNPAAAQTPAPAPASAPGLPAAAASAQSGFETHDLDWTDAERHRAVPVRLYWPAGAAADTRVPLVVFSHGIGGSRLGYRYIGQHLASHGIAALHLQHAGSDRALWGGNPLAVLDRLRGAASDTEAIDRVRDLRFALDELLERSAWGPRIAREHIAGAGHSYGANTMLLAAGAQVPRAGGVVSLREPRLKAVLLLSAPPIYGEADLRPILRPVAVPTLHITATEDVIRIPGYYSPASDRIDVFNATGGPFKALAVFEGGSHNIFTDRLSGGSPEFSAQVKQATKELALAFVQQVFDGQGEALLRWPGLHRGLVARWERQAAP